MYTLKLLFQRLQIDKTHPGSWENSRPPGAPLKITAWGKLEASGPLCSRERQTTTGPWEQLTAQHRNVATSFTQSSLNLKALTAPCLVPLIKSLAWKEKGRWSVRVWTGHLKKVPMKIQSLSLLIGFGSDRQPKLRCLFRFQWDRGCRSGLPFSVFKNSLL